MTHHQTQTQSKSQPISAHLRIANSHYAILGLHPSASVREIRHAYRELSKRYHPDTTNLPAIVATKKFQRLNEAYGILSNPERRSLYDVKIGYSRSYVIQSSPNLHQSAEDEQKWSNSAYLDPLDRPLSSGEVFALFIIGLTLIACLILAMAIALWRGDEVFPASALPRDLPIPQVSISSQRLSSHSMVK